MCSQLVPLSQSHQSLMCDKQTAAHCLHFIDVISASCPSQSPCVPCGVLQLQRSSPGSWPFSGSRWATTSPAVTPTPCPCATATPCQRGAAEGTTPPSESACPWIVTRPTSPWETCRLSARSTSGWHWPTPKARRRAERSPSRLRKTVSGRFYFTQWTANMTKDATVCWNKACNCYLCATATSLWRTGMFFMCALKCFNVIVYWALTSELLEFLVFRACSFMLR